MSTLVIVQGADNCETVCEDHESPQTGKMCLKTAKKYPWMFKMVR